MDRFVLLPHQINDYKLIVCPMMNCSLRCCESLFWKNNNVSIKKNFLNGYLTMDRSCNIKRIRSAWNIVGFGLKCWGFGLEKLTKVPVLQFHSSYKIVVDLHKFMRATSSIQKIQVQRCIEMHNTVILLA